MEIVVRGAFYKNIINTMSTNILHIEITKI